MQLHPTLASPYSGYTASLSQAGAPVAAAAAPGLNAVNLLTLQQLLATGGNAASAGSQYGAALNAATLGGLGVQAGEDSQLAKR